MPEWGPRKPGRIQLVLGVFSQSCSRTITATFAGHNFRSKKHQKNFYCEFRSAFKSGDRSEALAAARAKEQIGSKLGLELTVLPDGVCRKKKKVRFGAAGRKRVG